jgi:hypothetical protein
MSKPDPRKIIEEARKLESDRFKTRNTMWDEKDKLRFGKDVIDIPTPYAKGAKEYHTPIIEEEGRQLHLLVGAEGAVQEPAEGAEGDGRRAGRRRGHRRLRREKHRL